MSHRTLRTLAAAAFGLAAVGGAAATARADHPKAPYDPYGGYDDRYDDRGYGHDDRYGYDDPYGHDPYDDRYGDPYGRAPVHLGATPRLGYLTAKEAELLARVGHVFDRNRDGRLTGIENRGFVTLVMTLRHWEAADTNRSSRLNPQEAGASWYFGARFGYLDRNRDGHVLRDELIDVVVRDFRRDPNGFFRYYDGDLRRDRRYDRRTDGHWKRNEDVRVRQGGGVYRWVR